MAHAATILPLDGEGGPKRSFGSEGVNPGVSCDHLAPPPSAGHAPGTSPIKGEDKRCPETAS